MAYDFAFTEDILEGINSKISHLYRFVAWHPIRNSLFLISVTRYSGTEAFRITLIFPEEIIN